MPRQLMISDLIVNDACQPQLVLFKKVFPDGAAPTAQNIRKARKMGLDIDWFIRHMFPREVRREYMKRNNEIAKWTTDQLCDSSEGFWNIMSKATRKRNRLERDIILKYWDTDSSG